MLRLRTAVRFTLLGLASLPVAEVSAQPKPPVNPGPTLTTPVNFGAKPGATADLVLTGTNLTDVTGVWTSFGGTVAVPDGQKDATKLNVRVAVPAAAFGLYELRVATKFGLSNARPVCVDDLPEVKEADGNRSKSTPQKVPNPCVVVGQADAESSDFYRVPATAGVPLTLEVLGRRLGSQIDPVILIHDANGREMAGLYADDTPGLQTDARLTLTPKITTDYIVEVRDTTYRGGPEYGYRLRVGNFPGATTAYPVAVERGKATEVGFAGPGVKDALAVSVKATGQAATTVTPRFKSGGAGWPVPVLVTDVPQLTETEPNNDPKTANKLTLPCGVTAKFDLKNDLDCFRFAVVKGKKYGVTAVTAGINSPAEVLLKVQDDKGGKLAESNPTLPLCRAEFTAAADGDAVLVCEHLNYLAGPAEVYWLQLGEVLPDFTVTLGQDKFFVPLDGVGLLPVIGFGKLNGFASPVELTVTGTDGVSGKLTLPANANPTPALPIYLPVVVKPGSPLGASVVQVTATASVAGRDLVRRANVTDLVKAAYGGLPNPPPELTERVGVAVVPKGAFTLSVVLIKPGFPAKSGWNRLKPEATAGTTIQGTISVQRTAGFAEEVTLTSVVTPPNATFKFKPVAKDKSGVDFELVLAANVPVGPAQLIVRGAAKSGGRDAEAVSMPLAFAVLEAKKVEPKKADEPKKK